jgi:hypothetical protein
METFRDELAGPSSASDLEDRFFDRFVFNLHPPAGTGFSVLLGLGVYPPVDTIDGFAIVVTPAEQRNLRFSTELSRTDGLGAGPFRFRVEEPMRRWHLALGPNPTGLELDVRWQARTPAWFGDVVVPGSSSFEHLFQSGRYEGTIRLDGERRSVDGWYGQRDRSRGVRTLTGGQGLHIWFQAQFPDRSVGFLLVEDRAHRRLLLEGAVMPEDGPLDPITDVRHDLEFDAGLDLRAGRWLVSTAGGARYDITADGSAGGGFMAGGGYGGHHGRPVGPDHVEHDVYPLDGSITPAALDTPLTDRLTAFDWDGTAGTGILEFAHTRSRSYSYQASSVRPL